MTVVHVLQKENLARLRDIVAIFKLGKKTDSEKRDEIASFHKETLPPTCTSTDRYFLQR